MQRADSLEETLMLGKTEGKRRGWQRMRWLRVKDKSAWHAAVHGVAKTRTRLREWATTRRSKDLLTVQHSKLYSESVITSNAKESGQERHIYVYTHMCIYVLYVYIYIYTHITESLCHTSVTNTWSFWGPVLQLSGQPPPSFRWRYHCNHPISSLGQSSFSPLVLV